MKFILYFLSTSFAIQRISAFSIAVVPSSIQTAGKPRVETSLRATWSNGQGKEIVI
jgi:hypothetical protein